MIYNSLPWEVNGEAKDECWEGAGHIELLGERSSALCGFENYAPSQASVITFQHCKEVNSTLTLLSVHLYVPVIP